MTSTTRSAAHRAATRFRVSWRRELALLAALYGAYMPGSPSGTREGYRRGRNALLFATALGLIGFWLLPTAPPWLLDGAGFLDTMAVFNNWGWWGRPPVPPAAWRA